MSVAKRVAKNTGILYAKMAITVFISLYSTRLILNALGAEDFGIFNIVGGVIAMLGFFNSSMAAASQRFMSFAQGAGDFERQKNVFNVSVILHLLIALLVFVVLEIAGFFFFQHILNIPEARVPVAKLIYQFMIVSTLLTIISVPYDALINAHENMFYYAIVGIIEALLKLAIAIYITTTGYDRLTTYGLLFAMIALVRVSILRLYCHKNYPECEVGLKKHFNKPLFKEMSSFGGWSLLFSSASMVTMYGVSVVLNSFFGVLVNAAQGVATQISGQLMAFSNTMLKALNPVIVKSAGENDRRQMIKASVVGNKLSFFLFTFFSIPVIIEMPYILQLWLKNVPEFAVIFCQLTLFRLCLTQMTVTFGTTIAALGNIKEYNIVRSLVYVILLPVSYIMYKFEAAPYIIFINLIVMILISTFVNAYYVQKMCGYTINEFLKDIFSPCAGGAVINAIVAIIPLFLLPQGPLRLVLVLIISSITFIFSLLFIGLSNTEKKQMIQLIKGRLISKNIANHNSHEPA